MSSKRDHELISYRRLLSNFARELQNDDVERIAFIYLKEGSVECKDGFKLLLKLERLNHFSVDNISGLIKIADDVGRLDWKGKFQAYDQTRSSEVQAKRSQRKEPIPLPSEEFQCLEEVHEAFVHKLLTLEKEFQRIWNRETVTKEDGLKLLRKSEKELQEMQLELKKVSIKFKGSRSHSGCSSSSSSGSSGSELGTSPPDSTWTLTGHHRVERNRDKPMPAPRKPKPPPPYRSTEGKYQLAVEESTRHSSPLLRVPVMNAGKVSCDQPPPIPPKKQNSPRLPPKTSHRQSGTSEMCYTTTSMCVRLQKKLSEEEIKEVTEESDQTGDSGMETGSGTTEYGTVEEYKSAIKNPPILPEGSSQSNNLYTPLTEENKDQDQLYQEVLRR